ncbi:hypothetical protein HMSSN139_14590 [Paenibacillus sp. HMSSN-139]|nr:hypothetical protein HMSSN139_14590 [Paenibacillus sp. HMSSN-139]
MERGDQREIRSGCRDESEAGRYVPRENYSCEKPTLHYAGLAARECGYDILALEYGYQAARTELEYREIPKIIEDSERAVRQLIGSYEEIVFISKSLGTVVAGEVHRKLGAGANVRHIYLTPIPDTLPYIHETRAVVVYGTKDDLFPAELASRLTASNRLKIVSIPRCQSCPGDGTGGRKLGDFARAHRFI